MAARAHVIFPDYEIPGRLILSSLALYFEPDPANADTQFIRNGENYRSLFSHESDFRSESADRWEQDLGEEARRERERAEERRSERNLQVRRRLRWPYYLIQVRIIHTLFSNAALWLVSFVRHYSFSPCCHSPCHPSSLALSLARSSLACASAEVSHGRCGHGGVSQARGRTKHARLQLWD